MIDPVGQSFGRYHILSRLGEGGMAIVYKALDTRLEREVAVKVIRTDRLMGRESQNSIRRFEREARALARLTHPNIVPIVDYGEQDGQPFLVMPYLQGGTLKALLARPGRKGMDWREAVQIVLPVARALHYAHQMGIIHRDIKPSNILITDSGEPMLTDFGVAKILVDEGETAELTGSGIGIGTPEYMSPEQFHNRGVDARTDVYALGVVFFELITGRKPYEADTPAAVLIKQAVDPLPRPSRMVSGLPTAVERVILKALAKNPADRYPDMHGFSQALESLASQTDSQSRRMPDLPAWKPPTWLLPGVGMVLAAAALFALGWVSLDWIRQAWPAAAPAAQASVPQASPTLLVLTGAPAATQVPETAIPTATASPTPDPFLVPPPEGALARIGQGVVYDLAFSPDGQQLAVASGAGLGLYQAADLLPLDFIPGTGDRVDYSADGSRLAVGRQVYQLPDLTSQALAEVDSPYAFVQDFLGDRPVLLNYNFGTYSVMELYDQESGARLWQLAFEENKSLQPTLSPDGSLLVANTGDILYGSDRIVVYDTASATSLFRFDGSYYQALLSQDNQWLVTYRWASDGRESLSVYNLTSGQRTLRTDGRVSELLDLSPDGRFLAYTSDKRTLLVHDLQEDGQVASVDLGAVGQAAFTPDGQALVVHSGLELLLLDWRTGEVLARRPGFGLPVTAIAAPEGSGQLLAILDGIALVTYDLSGRGDAPRWQAAPESDLNLRDLSPDGTLVSANAYTPELTLWELATGRLTRVAGVDGEHGYTGFISPENTLLVTESDSLDLVNWTTRQVVFRAAPFESGYDREPTFSADGGWAAYCHREWDSWDSQSRTSALRQMTFVIDLQTMRQVRTINGCGPILSPDGSLVASDAVEVVQVQSGEVVYQGEPIDAWNYAQAFFPDSSAIVYGFSDGTLLVLSLQDGQRRIISAHRDRVTDLVFLPETGQMVSASSDGTLVIWEAASLKP